MQRFFVTRSSSQGREVVFALVFISCSNYDFALKAVQQRYAQLNGRAFQSKCTVSVPLNELEAEVRVLFAEPLELTLLALHVCIQHFHSIACIRDKLCETR
jgi:hypothetical protein